MTALPVPENDLQLALREAHEYLSLSSYDRGLAYATYDKAHAIKTARWYIEEAEPAADRTPTAKTVKTYRDLADAIAYQFYYLSKHAGIRVEFTVADPYTSSGDMFSRFFGSGVLTVFKTQPGLHPIWSDTENDRFRAVHDLLGHCTWSNSFGPKGEDAAYRSHVATLPREVLPAICSETRSQNATFNYGPLIDGRPKNTYARQSWLLSPSWVCEYNV